MKVLSTLSLAAALALAQSEPPQTLLEGFNFLSSVSWSGLKTYFQPSSNASVPTTYSSNASILTTHPSAQWAIPPVCMSSSSSSEPSCVFTSPTFANGRGISIITTPSNATALLQQPGLGQDRLPRNANTRFTPPPFEERSLEGAGRFLVANKSLHRGDRIFAHTPVVVISQEASEIADLATRHALFDQAVANLPPTTQELFWSLAAHQGGDKNAFEDRVETNAFGFDLHEEEYFVVNPEIARMNHDCRPNAAYFFDERTLTQYVHATRDIHPGEEITVLYTDIMQPRATRQAKLRASWGFECSCSLCTLHPSLAKQSDARLQRIEHLTEVLRDLPELGTGANGYHEPRTGASGYHEPASNHHEAGTRNANHEPGSLSAALELHSLIKQERLPPSPDASVRLALEYAAIGDAHMARLYGREAAEASMLEDGFVHASVKWARALAENPEGHWSWLKRGDAKSKSCGCGCGQKH